MKGWSGNAVKFGVASAVVTLLLNWIGNATATGARAGGTIGAATMAGLVGALISAVGTIVAFAIIVGSINASQCVVNNNTGVSSQTLLTTGGIVAGVFLSLIGLGVGAGAGAIGGLMGRRPAATTV